LLTRFSLGVERIKYIITLCPERSVAKKMHVQGMVWSPDSFIATRAMVES
jgi:hypothetical protein